ncbi:MAG: VCBS repeat-containing protein [Luteimonas sp.]
MHAKRPTSNPGRRRGETLKTLLIAAAGLAWAFNACVAFAQTPVPGFSLGPLQTYRDDTVWRRYAAVAIGDVTGDGRADLVASSEGLEPEVWVYAQGSDGALRAPISFPTFPTYRVPDLELVDLNEDGVRDIVVASGSTTFNVLISDRKGGFSSRSYPVPYDFNSVSAFDMNNDGHLDLVGVKYEPGQSVWEFAMVYGDGKGGFTGHVEFPSGAAADELVTWNQGVALSDVNADEYPDLVFLTTVPNYGSPAGYDGRLRIRYNDRAGGFLPPVTIAYPEMREGLAVGDFNRDGRQDIATSAIGEPQAWFYYQDATGHFIQSPVFHTHVNNAHPIVAADLNQDHYEDLLTLHDGWATFGFNPQGPMGIRFEDARGLTIPMSDYHRDSLAVGDFNNDHCNDIAISSGTQGIVFAYGSGCERPSPTTDINGDRKSDLAWRKPGSLAYWLMSGVYPTSTQDAGSAGAGFKVVAAGDYNGDGFLDFAWSNGFQLKFWLNNKRGGFTSTAVTYYAGGWQPFASVDLDADGKDDLLWAQGSHVAHWLMDGSRVRSSGYTGDGGVGFKVVATGDFDGDGTSDLALASSTRLKIWINQGAARFHVEPPIAFGGGWSPFAAGDLDGDGKSDLLWRSASGSALAFWLMDGARMRAGGYAGDAGAGFSLVATGDYNGDRAADLVFANGSQMKFWTNNGSGRFSSVTRAYSGGWQLFDPRIPAY